LKDTKNYFEMVSAELYGGKQF